MTKAPLALLRISSPVGRIELSADGESLLSLSIERGGALPLDEFPETPNPVLRRTARQLEEYFSGDRRDFDLPLSLNGTSFQLAVWQRLQRLGWGEVTSYGELGARLGHPSAARAIGGAVGANPIPIIVGCHRVLSAAGRVTGYSGGEGIKTKLWLLAHERITLAA